VKLVHDVALTPSRRAAHVLVTVRNSNIEAAIKLMRRRRDECGLSKLMKPQSRLFAYVPPSRGRAAKAYAAMVRRRRAVAHRRRRQEESGEPKFKMM
jgi:ribosomal protein S21